MTEPVSLLATDAPPLPRFLQLEPVGQCNLRCRMCAIPFREDGPPHGPNAFVSEQAFRDLLEQFPGLEHLQLQGLGEPTMHPGFFRMVRYAAARGITVSTNSNLTLWSQRRAEECADSGLAQLHASIDSVDPVVYERIRVRAHFPKVVRNLRRIVNACAARRSPMSIRIVAVLMRETLPGLPELVRFAAREGVREVFVQQLCHDFEESTLPARFIPMREFVERERVDTVPAASRGVVYAEARAEATRLGIELRLPPLTPSGETRTPPRCDWPWTGAYVSYDGRAMPCCMVGTPDRVNFGNVFRDGVAAVWGNDAYRAFRRGLADDAPAPVCRSCALYRGSF